jgi:hypothetical protein
MALVVTSCAGLKQKVAYEDLSINIRYNKQALELNTWQTDSIKFTRIQFYIGHVELYQGTKMVYTLAKSYTLIDLEKNLSLGKIPSDLKFDKIQMELGVDSATNCQGALSNDLDPINGMYWTWQSGYINTKIEGLSPWADKGEFTYHLGGYQKGQYAMQTIEIYTQENKINLDLESVINPKQLSIQNNLMTPGHAAIKLSEQLKNAFN